ncbi:hypothetical protein HN512_00920 [Candidatus Peregrinibacteria bacterium]|nr:hypothetical protein [Candidatus Peregrinibacteria bacterium]
MGPETPDYIPEDDTESPEEILEEDNTFDIFESAEILRSNLNIDDTPENWLAFIEDFATPPRNPSANDNSDHFQTDLVERYRQLDIRMTKIGNILIYVKREIDAGEDISIPVANAVKRNMAQYLEDRYIYHCMIDGTVPTSVDVPEYLGSYLDVSEEERMALSLSSVVLPLQYDVASRAQLTKTPVELSYFAEEILLNLVKRRISMRYILNCLDSSNNVKSDNESITQLLEICNFSDITNDDIEAAKLIVGYLGKNIENIRSHVQLSEINTVEEMTVGDALECCVHTIGFSEIANELVRSGRSFFQGEMPDVRESLDSIMSRTDIYTSNTVQVVLAPLADMNPSSTDEDKERFRGNIEEVLLFLLSDDADTVSIRNVESYISHLNSGQQNIINSLCERISTQQTVDSLMTTCLLSEEDGDLYNNVYNALNNHIVTNETLSIRDAFDIYYYLNVGSGSSIILGFKVIQILNKFDSDLAIELQTRQASLFYDMAKDAGINQNIDLLDRLNLTEEQERELNNMNLYLEESGVGEMNDMLNQYRHLWRYSPDLMSLLHAPPAIIVYGLGRRFFIKVNMAKLDAFVKLKDPGIQSFSRLHNVPPNRVLLFQEKVNKMMAGYDNIGFRWKPFLRRPERIRGTALMRAAEQSDLIEIARALRQRRGITPGLNFAPFKVRGYSDAMDTARILGQVSNNEDDIINALTQAGYGQKNIDEAMVWFRETRATSLAADGAPIAMEGEIVMRARQARQRIDLIFQQEGFDEYIRSIDSFDDEIRTLQRSIDNATDDVVRARLQRNLTRVLRQDKTARVNIAQQLLRRNNLSLEESASLMRAHRSGGSLGARRRELLTMFDADEAEILMRSGLAGNVDEAFSLSRARLATSLRSETIGFSHAELLARCGLPSDSVRLISLLDNEENAARLIEAYAQGGRGGSMRVSRYLMRLQEGGTASFGDEAADSILTFIARNSDVNPVRAADLVQDVARASGSADDCLRVLRHSVRTGTLMSRTLSACGFGVVDGLIVALDYYEGEVAAARLESMRLDLIGQLNRLANDVEGFERIGSGEYEGEGGVRISVQDIVDVHNADVEVEHIQMGVHAAEGVFFLGTAIAASTLAGPLALVAIPIVIAIDVGINQTKKAVDQDRRTEFINQAPTWLLAYLGSMGTLGMEETDIINEHNGLMRSEVVFGLSELLAGPMAANIRTESYNDDREPLKREVREKIFQTLCYREFLSEYPDLRFDLPESGDAQGLFGANSEFLSSGGDYEEIVRRGAILYLHAQNDYQTEMERLGYSRTTPIIPFSEIEDLDFTAVIERFYGIEFEELRFIDDEDITTSAQFGMLLEVNHRRELNYFEMIESIRAESTMEDGSVDTPLMDMLMEQLNQYVELNKAQMYVLNMHPNNFLSAHEGDGKTTVERMLDERYSAVGSATDIDSSNEASTGYLLPSSYDPYLNVSIDYVYNQVVPRYRAEEFYILSEYNSSNINDLPLSFEEMELWGDDENFRSNFAHRIINPLSRIEDFISSDTIRTGEYLDARSDTFIDFCETNMQNFGTYLAFNRHRGFYEGYTTHWRNAEHEFSRIPDDYSWIVEDLITQYSAIIQRRELATEFETDNWVEHVQTSSEGMDELVELAMGSRTSFRTIESREESGEGQFDGYSVMIEAINTAEEGEDPSPFYICTVHRYYAENTVYCSNNPDAYLHPFDDESYWHDPKEYLGYRYRHFSMVSEPDEYRAEQTALMAERDLFNEYRTYPNEYGNGYPNESILRVISNFAYDDVEIMLAEHEGCEMSYFGEITDMYESISFIGETAEEGVETTQRLQKRFLEDLHQVIDRNGLHSVDQRMNVLNTLKNNVEGGRYGRVI